MKVQLCRNPHNCILTETSCIRQAGIRGCITEKHISHVVSSIVILCFLFNRIMNLIFSLIGSQCKSNLVGSCDHTSLSTNQHGCRILNTLEFVTSFYGYSIEQTPHALLNVFFVCVCVFFFSSFLHSSMMAEWTFLIFGTMVINVIPLIHGFSNVVSYLQ